MKFKTHIFIDDNTFWGTSELSLVVSSLLSFDVSKVLVTKSVKRFSSKLHDAQKKSQNSKQEGLFSLESGMYVLNTDWSSYRATELTSHIDYPR